jgi:hypothetical protein
MDFSLVRRVRMPFCPIRHKNFSKIDPCPETFIQILRDFVAKV